MQTELDVLSKASRARSMQLAEQYVTLYKWKSSIWGTKRKHSDKGSAPSNKRKREQDAKKGDIKLVAVLGENKEKSSKGERLKKNGDMCWYSLIDGVLVVLRYATCHIAC